MEEINFFFSSSSDTQSSSSSSTSSSTYWMMTRVLATMVPTSDGIFPPMPSSSSDGSEMDSQDDYNFPGMTVKPESSTTTTTIIPTTTRPTSQSDTADDYPNNAAVVAVLIALICILFLILMSITLPPIIHMIKRKIPVSQARIDRRYATIDAWLIRKRVQGHDSICECIQRRYSSKYRQKMGLLSNTKNLSLTLGSTPSTTTTASTCNSKGTPSSTATADDQRQPQHRLLLPTIPMTAVILLEKLAPAGNDDPDDTEPLRDSSSSSSSSSTTCQLESNHPGPRETHRQVTMAEEGAIVDNNNEDDDENSITGTLSIDRPGCPICLEAFEVGDSVSWSTDPSCEHVFHHSCIREWLLRRTGCPCCRTILLPVDRPMSACTPAATTTTPTTTAPTTTVSDANQIPMGVNVTTTGTTSDEGNTRSPASLPPLTGLFSFPHANRRDRSTSTTSHSRRSSSTSVSAAARKKYHRLTQPMVQVLAEERSRRTTTTYYCIKDGLVTLDGFGLGRKPSGFMVHGGSPPKRNPRSPSKTSTTTSHTINNDIHNSKDIETGDTMRTSPSGSTDLGGTEDVTLTIGSGGEDVPCPTGDGSHSTQSGRSTPSPSLSSWLENLWSRKLRRGGDTTTTEVTATGGTSMTDDSGRTRISASPDLALDVQGEDRKKNNDKEEEKEDVEEVDGGGNDDSHDDYHLESTQEHDASIHDRLQVSPTSSSSSVAEQTDRMSGGVGSFDGSGTQLTIAGGDDGDVLQSVSAEDEELNNVRRELSSSSSSSLPPSPDELVQELTSILTMLDV